MNIRNALTNMVNDDLIDDWDRESPYYEWKDRLDSLEDELYNDQEDPDDIDEDWIL